jgi:arylformamidase
MALYDISIPLENGMATWPGDPGIQIDRVMDLDCGDPARVSRLALGSHTGTHVDTFSHFKPQGLSLDAMSLEPYLGKAFVVEVPDTDTLTPEDLAKAGLESLQGWGEIKRLLLKTRNSETLWSQRPFDEQFAHLTPEAADYLVRLDIGLLGVDYLSVDGYHAQGAPVHHRLMDHGTYILEGLCLKDVPVGWYELLCLPLKIHNGDGAPARAVLRTWPKEVS